jgi:hypothetical protein
MKNLESPQILSDLYRDLRDRRLLPLVVVLIVGIAIVPIALAKSPEPAPPPVATSSPVAAKSNVPSEQVVVADPGLRNYKKRLAGDPPRNPFIQQFSAATDVSGSASSATAPSDATDATGTATAPSVSTDSSTGSTSPSSSGGGTPSSGGGKTQYKYFSYRVKVRAGQLDGTPLKVYDSVGFLTPLPSGTVPALQLLGVKVDSNLIAKTAVFTVSPAVSSVSGEGNCTATSSACETLYLKPGEHEDFVWSDGLTYRLELVKFNLIARNGLPGTGEDKSGKGGKNGSAAGRKNSAQRFAGSYFSF